MTLSDSAVLSGGYYPTGSITFTLSGPDGFSYSQTDPVSGNGTYMASDTLPTTGTVAGTYTWSAAYSGDANNKVASETGSATNGEQTVVSAASPTIVTTASPAVTLPTGPSGTVTLSDSAVLSGGYYPTGSITFTLSGPDGFSYSQTDPVSGNGTYMASDTLPTTGTVAGTYTWSAAYSGDANNKVASETGSATNGEQTVVSTASPTIVTTASPTSVTLPTGPSGTVTLSDSAVLSGGYYPTGSITFTLSGPDGFSYSQTDPVSGNGTYMASDTLPTTGTVAGTYTWSAAYSGDANNKVASETGSATNGEQTVVSAASPTIVTTASPTSVTLPTGPSGTVTLSDSAVLSGRLLSDRQHHLHAERAGRLLLQADRPGQRQRHLHGQRHAADHGDGGRHLYLVGRLQRRCQQQGRQRDGQRHQRRADGGQRGQPDDRHDGQPGRHAADRPFGNGDAERLGGPVRGQLARPVASPSR